MKPSRQKFLGMEYKAITLMGMSGVGKTYISGLLEKSGWMRYSCDYVIGSKTLAPYLKDYLQSADDISPLSRFVGKLGNSALGGLDYETFKARQILYYEAECNAIRDAVNTIPAAQNFVHDSTGSLCEILNEDLLEQLGKKTLFVYLKAGKEEEDLVLRRAMETPKPLFYPQFQLEVWVDEYCSIHNVNRPEEIVPDDFARWVFPKLFAQRMPKYQKLADLYGVTIPCRDFYEAKNADDIVRCIAESL